MVSGSLKGVSTDLKEGVEKLELKYYDEFKFDMAVQKYEQDLYRVVFEAIKNHS